MKKYLQDPVLHLTATVLHVTRSFLLGFSGLSLVIGCIVLLIHFTVGPEFYASDKSLVTGTNDLIEIRLLPIIMLLASFAFYLWSRFCSALRAIILSVGHGDPFISDNAMRLRSMGWLMTASYLAMLLAGTALRYTYNEVLTPNHADIVSILTNLFYISILFILARVFDLGAEMRGELEGTV